MSQRVQLVVATAINLVTAVNEAIVSARKLGNDAQIALPGLRQRAKMVVNEQGLLPVQTVFTE